MHFSVREEIIILTSIYCFCLFTIPIIIIDANSKKGHGDDDIVHLNSSELEFQQKVLINSIMVLENLNKNPGQDSELFEFSDLLDLTEEDFLTNYPNALIPTKTSPKSQRKQLKNVWRKFKFVSRTLLTSESITLPLMVDW